jgi:hypothetical protein
MLDRQSRVVYQANWPGKSGMNIERQPTSLRVAASTAASVRIHRPTPVNPALAVEHSLEEPVRPASLLDTPWPSSGLGPPLILHHHYRIPIEWTLFEGCYVRRVKAESGCRSPA